MDEAPDQQATDIGDADDVSDAAAAIEALNGGATDGASDPGNGQAEDDAPSDSGDANEGSERTETTLNADFAKQFTDADAESEADAEDEEPDRFTQLAQKYLLPSAPAAGQQQTGQQQTGQQQQAGQQQGNQPPPDDSRLFSDQDLQELADDVSPKMLKTFQAMNDTYGRTVKVVETMAQMLVAQRNAENLRLRHEVNGWFKKNEATGLFKSDAAKAKAVNLAQQVVSRAQQAGEYLTLSDALDTILHTVRGKDAAQQQQAAGQKQAVQRAKQRHLRIDPAAPPTGRPVREAAVSDEDAAAKALQAWGSKKGVRVG